jgi:nucleotide-binding universal stress UspA family protein
MQELKRIVVAVDFSQPSVRVAELAADIARSRSAELVLLTVVEHLDSPQARLAHIAHNRYPNEPATLVVDAAARAELCMLGERLTAETGSPVACQVEVGEPAATILAFAERNAIDLIALGHTGRNRLVGAVLGSVAKRVIDTAVCPVLVVRL